jgi:hypothetical protein
MPPKKLPKFNIVKITAAAGPFRPIPEKLCAECPYRRKSMAGWLGRNRPEAFTDAIFTETPQPCHLSLDYEDKRWKEKWEAGKTGKLCRGALVLAANMCKLARDQTAIPRVPPDRDEVFGHGREFIEHHGTAKVRSWEK